MSGKVTEKFSVYMETYGCSANQSHSEVMLGLLRDKGYKIVKNPAEADILVINTCIVKEPTEKRMIYRIRKLREDYPKKKLVIAGCMPSGEYELLIKIEPNASLLGSKKSLKIVRCVRDTLKGKRMEYLDNSEVKFSDLKHRFNTHINIVEISEGCLGNCSYCIVRKAKGKLKSRPLSDIKTDIKKSLKEGCKEVWLTSQDCGCYGRDTGTNLLNLLRQVTKIKGNFRVRLGMSNPNQIKPVSKELIEIYKDKKMYKFLHIPVQSGSDKILRDMNRHYVTKDFTQIVNSFRSEIPDMTIWTDIISGFPGETNRDFGETLRLLKETKPDFVNVSKFGKRPGTIAEKMEQVHAEEIKRRSKITSELVRKLSFERNKTWLGRECQVLVTEKGLRKGQYTGRNSAYKSVLIETEKDIRGKFVTANITKAGLNYLLGTLKAENDHYPA